MYISHLMKSEEINSGHTQEEYKRLIYISRELKYFRYRYTNSFF